MMYICIILNNKKTSVTGCHEFIVFPVAFFDGTIKGFEKNNNNKLLALKKHRKCNEKYILCCICLGYYIRDNLWLLFTCKHDT